MRWATSMATKQALLAGQVSEAQGQIIANAAKVNPEAERGLIKKAKRTNHQQLREEALKAKAAADPDPAAQHRRIHTDRRLGRYTDAEGAWNLHARGTVADGSIISSEIDRLTDEIFRANGKAGTHECRDAYAFDALTEMARRSSGLRHGTPAKGEKKGLAAPQHLALLRLDVEALWRGYMEGDELCEITGLGPIPVEIAKTLLGDAVLKLVITKGVDVLNVTSLTRGPTQAMRYAKLWTSPMCIVEGCTRTIVEHDHVWGAEYKDTRHTRFDEIERTCHTPPRPPHHPRLGAGRRQGQAPDGPPRRPPPPSQRATRRGPRTASRGHIRHIATGRADRPLRRRCRLTRGTWPALFGQGRSAVQSRRLGAPSSDVPRSCSCSWMSRPAGSTSGPPGTACSGPCTRREESMRSRWCSCSTGKTS